MSESYWRAKAAPLIADVLSFNVDMPEAVIRKALRDAYPFGQRANHPYKIWCDEIRRQRGFKAKKDCRPAPELLARLAELKAEAYAPPPAAKETT